jgi:hypothetical protein
MGILDRLLADQTAAARVRTSLARAGLIVNGGVLQELECSY